MNSTIYRPSDIPQDTPVAHLARRRVQGDRILFAEVHLAKGCHVDPHQHDSEQIAYVMSGRVLWTLGAPGTPEHRQEISGAGSVVIIDILSPPAMMGIDRQGRE